MIVRDKLNDNLHNIKDVNIKFHGTFSDIINHSTAKFLNENTDPKVFFLEYINQKDEYVTRQYNIVSTGNVHGLLADLRFTLVKEKGYVITRLRTFYKPKTLIQDEHNHLTNGVIQDPVMYTIIFNNDIKKANE